VKYPGQDIRVGDVVAHEFEKGEWTVEGWDTLFVTLRGPPPERLRFHAVPAFLRLIRQAPKPPRAPRVPRRSLANPRERSVALNLGAHLGVARVPDDDDGEEVA
jgi:hypothetical protein